MFKKFKLIWVASFFVCLSQANAISINDAILMELPTGTYLGRTHKKGHCKISVKFSENIYRVKITHQDTSITRTFELRNENEQFIKVGARDLTKEEYHYLSNLDVYVSNLNLDPRTSVSVGRGKYIESNGSYLKGWEKENSLSIFDLNYSRSQKKNKWRVTISENLLGGTSPFAAISCEIDSLK